jgi:8-oxo-dGTP pyrophosphatase MutT (NUDIX family)
VQQIHHCQCYQATCLIPISSSLLFQASLSPTYNQSSFPYPTGPYANPSAYSSLLSTLYTLVWEDTPIGYIHEPVFNELVKVPTSITGELTVNHSNRTISAFPFPTEAERSSAVAATTTYWRLNKTFALLNGWRDELYPIYGPGNELLFSIERSAAALLGVVTYGVHMTAYTKVEGVSYGIKIWVPRRAKDKQTYGGMLDNTVAGGMATGENPLECLVRESDEEASLPSEFVRKNVKEEGTITYTYIREPRAGGESGMIQPECQYVYDLELPADVVPKPKDGEVECFYLWTVEEVQDHMARGEFKPNCAMLMLDFFVRWGILNEGNEKDFQQIKERLHRELEFPGPHRGL